MKMKQNRYRGGNFDGFLKEAGLYEEVCAAASKRVLARQISEALAARHKPVAELAREIKTSREAVNRILDGKNYSLSLKKLSRAASALGKRL